MTPGYVYLLRMLDSDHLYSSLEFGITGCSYKIGKSKTPITRHEAIAVKAPYPVEIIATMHVTDMAATETYFHRKLDRYRRRGEWFGLHSVHVAWFFGLVMLTTSDLFDFLNWHGITDQASIDHADSSFDQTVGIHLASGCDQDLRSHFTQEYRTL